MRRFLSNYFDLLFHIKRHGNILTVTPIMGALNAGGVGTNRDLWSVSGFIACCQRCDGQVLSTRCRRTVESVTLIAGSKRRSLLMARDDDEVFMTRSLSVTPTEQHLIVRSDKSVAFVTNNKRLYSTFCTTEANYWQTRSIARPFCNSTASCR